jgi:hypothetical protein
MHGHWDLPVSFSTTEQAEAVNMGVSIVVPAKKILETLYHPDLVAIRRAYYEKEIRGNNVSSADSGFKKPFTKLDCS